MMARLYTGRSVILTQAHSLHGMTVGATMMRGYRNNISTDDGFADVADVPGWPPHGYIPIPPPEHEDWAGEGPLPSLEATEHIVRAVGPENIAAVISEPMFGAGGTLPHMDYLPGLRALVNNFSSPEFFMLVMLGLVMASSLSGKSAARGLLMGGLGLMISMIGQAPGTGDTRFAGPFLYLWEGMPLIPIVLGLFAVPEVIDLAIRNTTIASSQVGRKVSGLWTGFVDCARNWWLVVKCSVVGVITGFIPGLGGAVAEWMSYAIAVASEKNPDSFGKGNIVAALLALILQRWLVMLCFIRANLLVPFILAAMIVGATFARLSFGDIMVFLAAGTLGYVFKHADWPRVPLVMGLIMGRIAEPYLFSTVDRYNYEWLYTRPIVVVLIIFICMALAAPYYRRWRNKGAPRTHIRGS